MDNQRTDNKETETIIVASLAVQVRAEENRLLTDVEKTEYFNEILAKANSLMPVLEALFGPDFVAGLSKVHCTERPISTQQQTPIRTDPHWVPRVVGEES